VCAATGGICLMYITMMVLSLFGIPMLGLRTGLVGIGISVVVVVVAALNLVLDFDYIENAANSGSPKYCEWYGAYGLMVTLVWLYIEILRLLTLLASRSQDE
ncbi:MAG: hypothetical protein FJ267_01890, partial [Planctomycetes bacterium]|nr:hypothetical protein [Planctomycetota bacterium]